MDWIVYILHCKDDTFYTGITNNLDKRIAAHNKGLGAKYTKGRAPLVLVYKELCNNRSSALKRELFIKSLNRNQKKELLKLM